MVRFQVTEIPPGAQRQVNDIHGRPITVQIEALGNQDRRMMQEVIDFIESRYDPEVFKVPLEGVLGACLSIGIVKTDHPSIGAYTGKEGSESGRRLIIINGRLFKVKDLRGRDELAITLLHEAMHAFDPDDVDKSANSVDEARHDIRCYIALGVNVPANHWGWKRLGVSPGSVSV